jgi:hypothetical protein
MKKKKKSLIVDARRTLSGSGKTKKDHNKHFFTTIKLSPVVDPRCSFGIGTFSREPI